MNRPERSTRSLSGLLAWLGIGIGLALGQNLLWPQLWSLTLVVWWSYLILTTVLLFRLLIQSRLMRVRARPRDMIWTLVALAALLWWSRPLWVQVGEDLFHLLRAPSTQTDNPGALAGGGGPLHRPGG